MSATGNMLFINQEALSIASKNPMANWKFNSLSRNTSYNKITEFKVNKQASTSGQENT